MRKIYKFSLGIKFFWRPRCPEINGRMVRDSFCGTRDKAKFKLTTLGRFEPIGRKKWHLPEGNWRSSIVVSCIWVIFVIGQSKKNLKSTVISKKFLPLTYGNYIIFRCTENPKRKRKSEAHFSPPINSLNHKSSKHPPIGIKIPIFCTKCRRNRANQYAKLHLWTASTSIYTRGKLEKTETIELK